VSLNRIQRSRWIADIISDLQKYKSKVRGEVEEPLVEKALLQLTEIKSKLQVKEDV
jgi:hypothetical protein